MTVCSIVGRGGGREADLLDISMFLTSVAFLTGSAMDTVVEQLIKVLTLLACVMKLGADQEPFPSPSSL